MDNKDFIKQWAQDDWNVGMTFDPDDYDTFCKICKEQGIECNYDLFEYYFECLDEIREKQFEDIEVDADLEGAKLHRDFPQFEDFKVEVNHDENGTKINAEGNDADEIVDLAKFIFGDDFDSEFDGPVDEEEIPAVEVPVDMIKIEEPHQVGEIKDEDIFEQEFDIEPIVAAAPEAEQAITSIEKVAVDAPCEGECCDGHCEEKHICPECGKELCECDKLEKDELLQEAALTSDFIKSMIDETKADLDKAESEEEKSTLQSKLDKLNSDYESLAKAEKEVKDKITGLSDSKVEFDGYADEDLSEKEPTATDLEKIEKELPPSWEDGWDDLSDEEFVEAFGKTLLKENSKLVEKGLFQKIGSGIKKVSKAIGRATKRAFTPEILDEYFKEYTIDKYEKADNGVDDDGANFESEKVSTYNAAVNKATNYSKISTNGIAKIRPTAVKDDKKVIEKELKVSEGKIVVAIYKEGQLVVNNCKTVLTDIYAAEDSNEGNNEQPKKHEEQTTVEQNDTQKETTSTEQPKDTTKGDRLNRQISNNKKINQALKDAGLDIPEDKLYTVYTDKAGKQRKKATDTLNALRNTLFGESLDEE